MNSLVDADCTWESILYPKQYTYMLLIFPCQASLLSYTSFVWWLINTLLTQITNTIIFSQLFEKNNQTMGCTKAEKDKLGKDWVDTLQLSYECHDFHGQVLKCHCISKLSNEELVTIKAYCKDSVATLWEVDHHIANRKFRWNRHLLWALSSSILHFEFSEAWLPSFNREELLHSLCQHWPGCLACLRSPAHLLDLWLQKERQLTLTCWRLHARWTLKRRCLQGFITTIMMFGTIKLF